MKFTVNPESLIPREQIELLIREFDEEGKTLFDKGRNTIKTFELEQGTINVKSFKVPNLINKIAYKYLRKSKAERSFSFATILKEKGVGTPNPIAYCEENSGILFGGSYYLSEHLDADLTYRELITEPDFPDHEIILRAFTRFTFELHEKDIQFLDHSPGNTLIKRGINSYHFFLVDLNRMNFKNLSFDARMQNFSRLTPKKAMVEIMANEYAGLIGKTEDEVFEKMWYYTRKFQQKFQRKKKMKRIIKK